MGYWLHIYGTLAHKFWIMCYISKFCLKLFYRALKHDLSKFSKAEMRGFAKHITELKNTTYGSEEYKVMLKELKPTIQHHYQHNCHHPENHKHGVYDFDLYDLVEMFYDWKASTKRSVNGNMEKSIRFNQKRFKINDDVIMIYFNTNKKIDQKINKIAKIQ